MSNHVSGCISTVHPDLTEKLQTDFGNTCACMPEPIYYLMSEQLVLTVNSNTSYLLHTKIIVGGSIKSLIIVFEHNLNL